MREEVRKTIDNNIVFLYQSAFSKTRISFPVMPLSVINSIKNCRCMSYSRLAAINHLSVDDVAKACQSNDGCTFYDVAKRRYLVLINHDQPLLTRIRWTAAHELGHIAANHFVELASFPGEQQICSPAIDEMENEAEYFAAEFLAPLPAIRMFNVQSPMEIRSIFGIGAVASEKRWREYCAPSHYNQQLDNLFARHKPAAPLRFVPKDNRRSIIDAYEL